MTTFTSAQRSLVASTGETWTLNGTVAALKHEDGGELYLRLEGTASNFVDTPDQTPFNFSGDFTVTVDMQLDDYTPATQQRLCGQYASTNISWLLYLNTTTGNPILLVSADGTATAKLFTVANPGWVDGTRYILQARYRKADPGSSNFSTCEFYYGEPGATLTLIGAKQAHTSSITMFNSTADLGVGASSDGAQCCTGRIYSMELRSGIAPAGSVVAEFRPNSQKAAETAIRQVINGNQVATITLNPLAGAASLPVRTTLLSAQSIESNAVGVAAAEEFSWVPSWSTKVSYRPRLQKAQFGDGYRQSLADGINSNPQTWTLVFENATDAQANAIVAFLSGKGGTTPFQWTPPGSAMPLRFVCEEYDRQVNEYNSNGLTMTFQQDFAP